MSESKNFLYFAYGSNLFAKRIHIQNPSAVRVGIGKLMDYRLDFLTWVKSWQGAVATIVTNANQHVWGTIWEIDFKQMASLDRQEGVEFNFYVPIMTEVQLTDGTMKMCRTYKQSKDPVFIGKLRDLPSDRLPSRIYLDVIKEGAKESNFPQYYLDFLNTIPHNGNTGSKELQTTLSLIYNNN